MTEKVASQLRIFFSCALRYGSLFPATFWLNCCQNAVKSRCVTNPKQLEASQLPVTPPEKLVELRGIEPLILRLSERKKGEK